MRSLMVKVRDSIAEDKVKSLIQGVFYRYDIGYKRCPYRIMGDAIRRYRIEPKADGTIEGNRKAINRWFNGGLQVALKEIAKNVVANGTYRSFLSDNMTTFHLSCFPPNRW